MHLDEHDKNSRKQERRSPWLYWRLETATEFLIYTILVFTPWAFGTTEQWSIDSVNSLNYVLGGLLVAKWVTCVVTRFKPARWGEGGGFGRYWTTVALAFCTVVMLALCAIAAWNARATYVWEEGRFDYFTNFNKWLPFSYDRDSTWVAFRLYLAGACFFWSVRDWLLTKDRVEARRSHIVNERERHDSFRSSEKEAFRPPLRLRRLLWVLCLNAALLGLEASLQRLSGTNELLWMVKPHYNAVARAQFGPFNYRSNGAQYMNLMWPVALGFWWVLHQRRRNKLGEGVEFVLLPLAAIMLAGPIISTSRGGIAVTLIEVTFVIAIFAYGLRHAKWWKIGLVVCLFGIIVSSTIAFQWSALAVRLGENSFNTMSGRSEIYANTKKIVNDFPIWGTGAGTFPSVYQLYREDPDQIWFAMAHNDFLQTRATFGIVGLIIIEVMFLLVAGHWWFSKGITAPFQFVSFLWVAVAGCLIHARFDFPFQIYSLLLLFLTICAILTSLGRTFPGAKPQ
jgi:hypothetical protein